MFHPTARIAYLEHNRWKHYFTITTVVTVSGAREFPCARALSSLRRRAVTLIAQTSAFAVIASPPRSPGYYPRFRRTVPAWGEKSGTLWDICRLFRTFGASLRGGSAGDGDGRCVRQ